MALHENNVSEATFDYWLFKTQIKLACTPAILDTEAGV